MNMTSQFINHFVIEVINIVEFIRMAVTNTLGKSKRFFMCNQYRIPKRNATHTVFHCFYGCPNIHTRHRCQRHIGKFSLLCCHSLFSHLYASYLYTGVSNIPVVKIPVFVQICCFCPVTSRRTLFFKERIILISKSPYRRHWLLIIAIIFANPDNGFPIF